MKKAELDAMDIDGLLSLPDDTVIEDFDKDAWRAAWFQAVEQWWQDGMELYNAMKNGFTGFLERSEFTIYCDLRFTYIDGQDMTWDKLAAENDEVGKHS